MGSRELKTYCLKTNVSEQNNVSSVAGQPASVPHPSRSGTHPAGGNILFAVGSANGVKFENMYFMNAFSLGIARYFAYQEEWGCLTSIQVARMQPLSGDFN
jgi:hypothetical protein